MYIVGMETQSSVKPLTEEELRLMISERVAHLTKLQNRKNSRTTALIIGIGLMGVWFYILISGNLKAEANPASVAPLGTILASPLFFLGLIFFLIGVFGSMAAQREVIDAERALSDAQAALSELKQTSTAPNPQQVE